MSFFTKAQDTYFALSRGSRALFLFLAGVCVVSSVSLLYLLNDSLLSPTPAYGGSLTEGVIGSPRFINPVLALSDSDRDLTALLYSGLLRATPSGEYLPDLAASYSISPDGKTYTFIVRADATFHDGSIVTASDVVYTVQKAQDPALKSPMRANWDGVVVAAVDEHTVQFTLKQPYGPFIENMTLGVLPKHLWQNVTDDEFSFSELNSAPVGSGPYKSGGVSRTNSGIPASYTLRSFAGYVGGRPYLSQIILRFYQSEDALLLALQRGEIESASGMSPDSLVDIPGVSISTAPFNRVFAVFFNQNQSEVLRDHAVRTALGSAVDKKALVGAVLGGYGTVLNGPLPPSLAGSGSPAPTTTPASNQDSAAAAQQFLIKQGWVLGSDGVLTKTTGKSKDAKTIRLEFSLATDNVPELRAAAEFVRAAWVQMGAKVNVQIYDQGDLSQNVIRPRKYDALLFGEVVGREADLYAFWSSSERNDPGLNIAGYTNVAADKLLGQLRETLDDAERANLYNQFQTLLSNDIPAVFLYAPDFVYTVPNNLYGLNLGFIEKPSDRFLSIAQWHRQVEYVWPMFTK